MLSCPQHQKCFSSLPLWGLSLFLSLIFLLFLLAVNPFNLFSEYHLFVHWYCLLMASASLWPQNLCNLPFLCSLNFTTYYQLPTSASQFQLCKSVNLIDSFHFISVQFSSVAQSCPTLCDPMNRSTPGLPVHHQLPEFTQTHAHRVSDAIQPSHPLLSPSSPAPNPSQHQGLFQWSQLFAWGGQSIGVSASASVRPVNTQDWSPSGWTGWISLQSKELLRVFSNITVHKHQFFGTQLSSQSNSHVRTWPLEKP